MTELTEAKVREVAQFLKAGGWQARASDLKMLQELAEHWLASQWQPIETAPRDGTEILLGYFLEAGGGGRPSVAFWHDIHKKWCGNEGLLNAEGYFSPTHWQPLPIPPATK